MAFIIRGFNNNFNLSKEQNIEPIVLSCSGNVRINHDFK